MESDYDYVFWQNMPSLHQAPFMRALAGLNKRVLVIVPEDISNELVTKGWTNIDYGEAEVVIASSPSVRANYIEATRTATAHTFSGLGAYPAVAAAMDDLLRGAHGHVAVLSESWDSRGIRGSLRAARFLTRRHALKSVDTVFAIGTDAARQFEALGCPPSRISPFGYFVDAIEQEASQTTRTQTEFLFVGTFHEWKNPLGVVDAISALAPDGWHVTMIGDGPLWSRVVRVVQERGLGDSVRFVQRIENKELRKVMARSDALVLPSKYDGWGAVVNEALMVGTPAFVSTSCGARDLIHSGLQGHLFSPTDTAELAELLRTHQRPTDHERKRLRAWAAANISPRVAAEYFCETVTRQDRAIQRPPWSSSDQKRSADRV